MGRRGPRVAQDSLRSQIPMLRSHASAFVWANASDGRPPPASWSRYHRSCGICTGRTPSSTPCRRHQRADGQRVWDGIQMAGPVHLAAAELLVHRRYRATRGASAEQGDNEHIPPFASLQKFIPPDKLWPINDTWYFHAGLQPRNAALTSIQRAINRRYGPSGSAEEFTRKAQLGTLRVDARPVRGLRRGRVGRPQDDHLLDAQQPLAVVLRPPLRLLPAPRRRLLRRQEGAAAAVGGLRLLRHRRPRRGQVTVVNQTPADRSGLRVRVRVYDLQGRVREDERRRRHIDVALRRCARRP